MSTAAGTAARHAPGSCDIRIDGGTSVAAPAMAPGALFVESAGDGPPLVLLHGFALHGGLFAPIVAPLARTRSVHVVDLPGHGKSARDPVADAGESVAADATADTAAHMAAGAIRGGTRDDMADAATGRVGAATLAALVDAVATFIARLGAPAHVLGWSLGGIVAQRLALDHPRLVRSLALVCTTPRFVTAPDWSPAMTPATLARFGDELRSNGRATLQRFLSLQVQGRGEAGVVGRDVLATLRASLLDRPIPSSATLAAMLAVLAGTDLRAEAAGIQAPALVVTGPRDALTPAPAGEWLAAHIPGARHVTIAGAAHAPFLSHPAAFLAAVRQFLDDVDAAALQRA